MRDKYLQTRPDLIQNAHVNKLNIGEDLYELKIE